MRGLRNLCRGYTGGLSISTCQTRHFAKRVTKGVVLPQGLQQPLGPLSAAAPTVSKVTGHDGQATEALVPATRTLQYSTVLQGALDNIQKYPHCVLLTRVGGFYELYFNHAEDLHQDLGLKRSYRDTKLGPVAMAGFPFFQLDRFLKMLVADMGKNVAISEEFPRESGPLGHAPVDLNDKNLFERRVSRIITPGTLIDEKFMETEQSHFLLSISRSESTAVTTKEDDLFGMAWMDLSTGEFFTQQVSSSSLLSQVRRIQPREIVSTLPSLPLPSDFEVTLITSESVCTSAWESRVSPSTEQFSPIEVHAGSSLLSYIAANLPDTEIAIQPPVRKQGSDSMALDSNALYSLEIRESMRNRTLRGSLLHAVKRTVTKSGTRLLSDWLISPITSIPLLEQRLDLIQMLIEDETLRADVQRFLKNSGDAVRVLQRFGFGRGEVDDLLTITKAISSTSELLGLLKCHDKAISLTSRMEVATALRKKIVNSIDEEGLMKRNRDDAESAAAMMAEVLNAISGPKKPVERRRKAIEREMTYTMRPSASSALRQMHKDLTAMTTEKTELEARLRAETGMQSLTLKTLPGLSHIVHIKGSDVKSEFPASLMARSVGSTRSTKSFHISEWSFLGTRIEGEKMRIQQEETRTFQQLRKEVLKHSSILRRNARVLDELDVAHSFAILAIENHWIRPHYTTEKQTEIRDGRHPVVEAALRARGLSFTPNSISFSPADAPEAGRLMYVITGTNMGGKSTYLRQTAVLQILAQVGSFIPAAPGARIGIVSSIYSRLGASDSLYDNQSTFMVEMTETADILRQADASSLVLMDEVGRGTTSRDGLAIAFATLHALRQIGCRVLFATHFHDLAASMTAWPTVGFLCTNLVSQRPGDTDDGEDEGDADFSLSHRIEQGVCTDSHGLKVARLAGIPNHVLEVAERMRNDLQ